ASARCVLSCSATRVCMPVLCSLLLRPRSTLFPYTTLFRSAVSAVIHGLEAQSTNDAEVLAQVLSLYHAEEYGLSTWAKTSASLRSEEHTSELQSRFDLVCRLLLEKKKKNRSVFTGDPIMGQ